MYKIVLKEKIKFLIIYFSLLLFCVFSLLWYYRYSNQSKLLQIFNKNYFDSLRFCFSLGLSFIYFGFIVLIKPIYSIDFYRIENEVYTFKNYKFVIALKMFFLLIGGFFVFLTIYQIDFKEFRELDFGIGDYITMSLLLLIIIIYCLPVFYMFKQIFQNNNDYLKISSTFISFKDNDSGDENTIQFSEIKNIEKNEQKLGKYYYVTCFYIETYAGKTYRLKMEQMSLLYQSDFICLILEKYFKIEHISEI